MSQSGRGKGGRLAARCIVLDAEHWLAPGEIVWDARGCVVRLARAARAETDLCLLPGLVDAHVHLQIEPLPAAAPREFVPWAASVMAALQSSTPAQRRARIASALQQLLADGATAFGEIDSTGHSLAELARSPATGRCYRELTGFHLGDEASRRLVRDRGQAPRGDVATGLSPHAPYSVSADLFRAALATRRHLAVHCAETTAEQQFLRHGEGPFRALLAGLGRLPAGFRPAGKGAVRWLQELGVLGARTLLVHCQELERGDAARIAATGAAIVVCPGTIAWFGRTPPPVPRWLRAGIPVALGTDSRASNARWSLRAELQLAASFWPELRPAELFAMATSQGGRALGRPGLGRLRRGGRADFVAVAAEGTPARLLAEFVHGGCVPEFVVAGGVRIAPDAQRG